MIRETSMDRNIYFTSREIFEEGAEHYKKNSKEYIKRSVSSLFPALCIVLLLAAISFLFSVGGSLKLLAWVLIPIVFVSGYYFLRWRTALMMGLYRDLDGEFSLTSRCYRNAKEKVSQVFKTYLVTVAILFIPALICVRLPINTFWRIFWAVLFYLVAVVVMMVQRIMENQTMNIEYIDWYKQAKILIKGKRSQLYSMNLVLITLGLIPFIPILFQSRTGFTISSIWFWLFAILCYAIGVAVHPFVLSCNALIYRKLFHSVTYVNNPVSEETPEGADTIVVEAKMEESQPAYQQQVVTNHNNVVDKDSIPAGAYVVGGLSLFPLLGFVCGLISIILGIGYWKRKGWRLLALGLAGILFSASIYGSLWYFGFVQRGGIYDDLRAEITQDNLTELVTALEYYKIQNGEYPETLHDLRAVSSTPLNIFDMSASVVGKQPFVFFKYRLVEDGAAYYLYSVGVDLKPYTEDDIFPEITEEEMKNIGFRIRGE